MTEILPPLPASDPKSLEHNNYDLNYRVRVKDFWKHNEINSFQEKPDVRCEHEFEYTVNGVECKKCHFGLVGQLDVQDGKLFYKGQQIKL